MILDHSHNYSKAIKASYQENRRLSADVKAEASYHWTSMWNLGVGTFQQINLETVSMLSFGQVLTGLEVRS